MEVVNPEGDEPENAVGLEEERAEPAAMVSGDDWPLREGGAADVGTETATPEQEETAVVEVEIVEPAVEPSAETDGEPSAQPSAKPKPSSRSWYEQCVDEWKEEEEERLRQAALNSRNIGVSNDIATGDEEEQRRRQIIAKGEAREEALRRAVEDEREAQRARERERRAAAAEARMGQRRDIAGPSNERASVRPLSPSEEERESRRAERELQEYLQADAPRSTPRRSETCAAPSLWLPISTGPTGPLAWDLDEEEEAGPSGLNARYPVVPPASPTSCRNQGARPKTSQKKSNKKKKAYNERRQLTVEDHHGYLEPSRSSSPLPGPENVVHRTSQQQGRPNERVANVATARLPIRLRGVSFAGLQPMSTDPRVDPPAYSCFNCWQERHTAAQCPWPRRSFCMNCGRRGVEVSSCPRCRQAYQVMLEQVRERRSRRVEEQQRERRSGEGRRICDRCGRRSESQPSCSHCETSSHSSSVVSNGSRSETERRSARTSVDERRRRESRDEQRAQARTSPPTPQPRAAAEPTAFEASRQSARARLGPPPTLEAPRAPTPRNAPIPARQLPAAPEEADRRQAIREARAIIEGTLDLPAATRNEMIRYLFSICPRESREAERRD